MNRIGIDLGGTKILAVSATEKGEVLHTVRRPTPSGDVGALMDELVSVVEDLRVNAPDPHAPTCVGVGVAGAVHRAEGLVFGPNLGLGGYPLARELGARLHCPVHMCNDVNCALMGEWAFGAASGAKDAVGLFIGTGIGSAFIVDGKMLRGARGMGAEAGHMICTPGGRPCVCGKRGCFEAYAGGRSIEAMVADACKVNPDSALAREECRDFSSVRRCMLADDGTARRIWEEVISSLRLLVGNLVTLFDPEVFVVGGSVADKTPDVRATLKQFVQQPGFQGMVYSARLVAPALGDRSAALGATLLGGPKCGSAPA